MVWWWRTVRICARRRCNVFYLSVAPITQEYRVVIVPRLAHETVTVIYGLARVTVGKRVWQCGSMRGR